MSEKLRTVFSPPSAIRRLFASWMTAAAVEYILPRGASKELSSLKGLESMSLLRVIIITLMLFSALSACAFRTETRKHERLLAVAGFALAAITSLTSSFTLPFAILCAALAAALTVYAIRGRNVSDENASVPSFRGERIWASVTAFLTLAFFTFVSLWTVCRVLAFCVPTYDFGIFSQMFENMLHTGAPVTTVEREVTMSHFGVHVSPIYYLMLPFYALVPRPETLQVLQAAVLASAVIPLWKIAKHHGFSPILRTVICAAFLLYPALSGGTSYDLHENCFLTPLILWLMLGIDRMSIPITAVAAVLTLSVKEDAAVYVAVAALYVFAKSLVVNSSDRKKELITAASLFAVSVICFLCTTAYLASFGDGVMTERYKNFMYDGSSSLFTVIKAAVMCPMKLLYECVDSEKITFILQMLIPILGMPFITRRYHRYILLIPFVLINLMSDYVYQHDIFFQYTFGSTAFLFYLTVQNLADIGRIRVKAVIISVSAVLSAASFAFLIVPKAAKYPSYYFENKDYFTTLSDTLDLIPEDASVAATGFYTAQLSKHELLYDVSYATREQLLACEYVALDPGLSGDYRKFKHGGTEGFAALIEILTENGYGLFAEVKNMVIYKKSE